MSKTTERGLEPRNQRRYCLFVCFDVAPKNRSTYQLIERDSVNEQGTTYESAFFWKNKQTDPQFRDRVNINITFHSRSPVDDPETRTART
jgi:hypothetical protein